MIIYQKNFIEDWNKKIIYAPNGFGKTTNANKLFNDLSLNNKPLIFTRRKIENLVGSYNNEIYFGETAKNVEKNKKLKDTLKSTKMINNFFKKNYSSSDIRKLRGSSFFINKLKIKHLDDIEDFMELSFNYVSNNNINEVIELDKSLNYSMYEEIGNLLTIEDKEKFERKITNKTYISKEIYDYLLKLKEYVEYSKPFSCPLCGTKFKDEEEILLSIEKKLNEYYYDDLQNLYERLLKIYKEIKKIAVLNKYLFQDNFEIGEEEFAPKNMLKVLCRFTFLCEENVKNIAYILGNLFIDNEYTLSKMIKEYNENKLMVSNERQNIDNINNFNEYIIDELKKITTNNVDFIPIKGKLGIKIIVDGSELDNTIYNILSESEIKRFSIVVLRALIKFGNYDALILDDPIDSYDDYYVDIACNYINEVVQEDKLKYWYILTNMFEALLKFSQILNKDSKIYYQSPDYIFDSTCDQIESFDAKSSEVKVLSNNELILFNNYMNGNLKIDKDLGLITFIVTVRNFKTIILEQYPNVKIVQKQDSINGKAELVEDKNINEDIKKYIEHYYMHFDEKIDDIAKINSYTLPINIIANIFNRIINSELLNKYINNNDSIVELREKMAKIPFNQLSGFKIMNLIFKKIVIVSYLKFSFEELLILKLKNNYNYTNEEIEEICQAKSLGKKYNCALEKNNKNQRKADNFLNEYNKVMMDNQVLYNSFDHGLSRMIPPYIATSVIDIKKFKDKIETLKTKY